MVEWEIVNRVFVYSLLGGLRWWFGAKPIPSVPFPPNAGKGKQSIDCLINIEAYRFRACRFAAKSSPFDGSLF